MKKFVTFVERSVFNLLCPWNLHHLQCLLAAKIFKTAHPEIIPNYNHCTSLILYIIVSSILSHIDSPGGNFERRSLFLLTGIANERYQEYQKGDGPGTTQRPTNLHLWTVLGPQNTGLSPLYVRSPTLWLALRRGPSGLAADSGTLFR